MKQPSFFIILVEKPQHKIKMYTKDQYVNVINTKNYNHRKSNKNIEVMWSTKLKRRAHTEWLKCNNKSV